MLLKWDLAANWGREQVYIAFIIILLSCYPSCNSQVIRIVAEYTLDVITIDVAMTEVMNTVLVPYTVVVQIVLVKSYIIVGQNRTNDDCFSFEISPTVRFLINQSYQLSECTI